MGRVIIIKNMPTEKEGFNIMKKLLAMLLVAVMSFSLVACGGETETDSNDKQQEISQTDNENASKNSVVGKWEYAEENSTLVLNEDNSGELTNNDKTEAITWKYDDDSHTILVTLVDSDWTEECTYMAEDDTIYVDQWLYSRVTE